MNYSQEIEKIEFDAYQYHDDDTAYYLNKEFEKLLTLAKKMLERINEIDKMLDYACAFNDGRKFPHWIPCSERLPEDDGTYLITGKSIYTFKDPTFWTDIAVFEDDDWNGKNVIAWMPLPEPFKGDL